MICRRIWRSYGRRWWLCSASSHTSPPPPPPRACQQKSPLLGFSSQVFTTDLNIPYDMRRCCFSTQAVIDLQVGGIVDVPLAQTGEGIAECELLKWYVQEGDEIEEFQPLCEVQSDKATIEITSRYKGRVSQIVHVPGDIVRVGETLLKMAVGELLVAAQTSENFENMKSVSSEICNSNSESSVLKKASIGGVLSTPAVRNLAKQYGVDISDVNGSGKDGRVIREDVLKYASNKGIAQEALTSSSDSSEEKECPHVSAEHGWDCEDKTVVLRGFQRVMVKSMTLAAKIPHFHYVEEINCDALVELKASFQNENSDPNVKHTFLPVLIKSLSMALSKYPFLNSCFNEELQTVTLKGSHNIGIAMATQHGLVVPNIKKVQSLSILEITKELSRLQQLALANKLSPDDVSSGTITLSNIGAIGGKFGSPLVNTPEVAIIAIGRIQKSPQFDDDGNVYPVSVMSVNVGADHRVLDGATVARFCNEWKLFIEKPELLMLHMR
ncbi:Lipoamide acyltransferase component of branched-chain alpha-keto acid dehydrogenase [Actinidia chinensis var. chinensis]|uniref:Dihydrolipoamide acetyltransferase component of pyruvate dehydrogenase complex n=1 Tax=Actinidia chinensis var. chinensis TaxID=1590841 RepID=A0A2R6PJQ7_ACTCC|nr:Lipoamide acyltransferase component of branched-chain alpha-keto acid dehydrogenase [Actinidia chinensis var. chinensis]